MDAWVSLGSDDTAWVQCFDDVISSNVLLIRRAFKPFLAVFYNACNSVEVNQPFEKSKFSKNLEIKN